MKKLIFAAVFLFTAAAQADMVSVKKAKCSMFGNLKIKVSGLSSYGSVGTGYLKANLPMSTDCDSVVSNFRSTMGRSATSANVAAKTFTVQREIERGGRDDKRTTMCEVSKKSVIKLTFPKFSSIVFKNSTSRVVRTYYGYCR